MRTLTAVIYPDEQTDWLVAECPEIGIASQGKTEEAAWANLKEATELYLESFPQTRLKPARITRFTRSPASSPQAVVDDRCGSNRSERQSRCLVLLHDAR